MKKIFVSLIFLSAAILAVSCSREDFTDNEIGGKAIEEPIPEGFVKMEIIAGGEQTSKTALADDGAVTWSNGDEVKFLYQGGSRKATIATTAASASITAILPETGNVFGSYPSGSAKLSAESSDVVEMTIKSKQDGTFANGNYSVAKLDRSNGTATFRNVASFLKLTIPASYQGDDITRVEIVSPDSTALAGTFPVTFDGSGNIEIGECSDKSNKLTMNVDGAGTYYFAILPGVTHSKGINVLFYTSSSYDVIPSYYYNKPFSLARNKVVDLGEFNPNPGNLYVSVDGCGNKSGFSADNAMSFAAWVSKVQATPDDAEHKAERTAMLRTLDRTTFHFAAGEYGFAFGDNGLEVGRYGYVTKDDVTRPVQMTLQGEEGTVFSGGGEHSILCIISGLNLTINDIAFADAHATASNAGGALYLSNNSSTVELNRCSFSDCTQAVDNGSGSALSVRYGSLTANDCTFSSNNAHAGSSINVNPNGGDSIPTAVFNNCTVQGSTRGPAVRVTNGTATFNGCTIKDNIHTNSSNHGNLLCQDGAEVYVYGCTFSGNSSKEGGAICCTKDAQVTVGDLGSTHTTFNGNTAANWNGGAIKAKGSGTISVTNAVFTSNKALNSSNSGRGGAVFIEGDVNLDLDGCSFTGNQSYSFGGALDVIGKGEVSVSDCVFDANVSTNQKGMSINVDGDEGAEGATTADFTNCTVKNTNSAKGPAVQIYKATVTFTGGSFENNVNDSGNHGALRVVGGANVTVKGVAFTGNSSQTGGAIYAADASTVLTINDNGVTHTTFTNNKATKYEGGAISVNGAAELSATGAVFSGNSAVQKAGAVMCKNTGDSDFSACSFSSNKTTSTTFTGGSKEYCGGAMFIGGESENAGSDVTITDCEFSGNTSASGYAGAIHIPTERVNGKLVISGGNFTGNGNTGTSGGVITMYGTMPVEINGTLFSENKGDYGACFNTISSSELTCTNCVFKGNYTKTDGGNVWKYYGGVWYSKTGSPKAVFNKCYFGSNYSNRGAVAHIDSGSATLYYNDCAMTGNYVKNRCGVVFSNAAGSELYLNNCSMAGSYSTYNSNNNNSSWIYNSGKLFLSNCTIAGDAKYNTSSKLASSGHISNNDTSGSIYMVNCIDAPATDWCFAIHQKTEWTDAKFYACKMNTYTFAKSNFELDTSEETLNGENYITSSFGSMTENKPASGSEAWDKYYWSWNGTMTGTNNTMATLANVNKKIQDLAPDFYDWLGTVDGLNKDCRGKTRGTYTWPGAYDGTNN